MSIWQRNTGVGECSFHDMLKRAKDGDDESISYLYHHFFSIVFGYIYNRVKDHHTAEDLTSAVFFKMVENIRKIRANNEVSFKAWLLKVARAMIAQHYHSHRNLECVSLDTAMEYPCVTEKRSAVTEAFNALTEDQKQALDGTVILGYSADEVGRMMGKKANTVRGLQFRGINAMRRILVAATLVILFCLGITIKLIHDASPGSPLYQIKMLGKRIVHPNQQQEQQPKIQATPTSTVIPSMQPVLPSISTVTPTATPDNKNSSNQVTPTATSVDNGHIACVSTLLKVCA